MNQIIPILIHTKKTYDGSYFYVDYDVNVSAVISHQAAQTLIDDESNALKEKYRKKDACLGESYDNCFTRIRGPYDGQGIPMSREDVWWSLILQKNIWGRSSGAVVLAWLLCLTHSLMTIIQGIPCSESHGGMCRKGYCRRACV